MSSGRSGEAEQVTLTHASTTKRSRSFQSPSGWKERSGAAKNRSTTMEESTTVPADAGSRPPLGTLPVLVYDHGLDPNNRQTALAIGDQSLHTGVVPELADYYYYVTPHGWVLLVAPGPSPRTTCLWDPRTGERVSLPAMDGELPEYGDDWRCSLSDAPTAASCHVLVLHTRKPSFRYCRVGGGDDDDGWKSHDYDIGNLMRPPPDHATPGPSVVIHEAAAVGGKFYFHEKPRKLGAVDLSQATPELSFVDYQEPELPEGCNICRGHLVASRGELFDVQICHKEFSAEVLTVGVYRVHLSGAEAGAATPRQVKDLGDRAFLLSYPNSQLLVSASKYGIKGNRVYFNHNVLDERDGGLLCIYDLDEQRLEAVRPCPDIPELLRNPFWVLPTSTHHDI